eukprot:gene9636-9713_t
MGVALVKIISNIECRRKVDPQFFAGPCLFVAAFLMAGCSVSMPLGGLADITPLGSIKKTVPMNDAKLEPSADSLDMTSLGSLAPKASPSKQPIVLSGSPSLLSNYIDHADVPSAHSALNAALDPKRPIQSVAWSNPQTGSSGAFVPVETKAAEGCKNFLSVVHPKANLPAKTMQGTACHDENGRWTVRNLAPATKTS